MIAQTFIFLRNSRFQRIFIVRTLQQRQDLTNSFMRLSLPFK